MHDSSVLRGIGQSEAWSTSGGPRFLDFPPCRDTPLVSKGSKDQVNIKRTIYRRQHSPCFLLQLRLPCV